MRFSLHSLMLILKREPLVHFVIIATLIFGLEFVLPGQKEKLLIDQQTADFLIKQREDLELRKLGMDERQQVIDAFVEDEILYREAYKRGLDKGDTRMRRNLIRKMRGLLMGEMRKPSDQELKDYFEANRAKYSGPATLSLEHVYFRDPSDVPEELIQELRDGRDYQTVGEPLYPYGRSVLRVSNRELVSILGSEAAQQIVPLTDRQWHGPFESNNGAHFVRIIDRRAAQQPRYEDVKSYLAAEWPIIQSRATVEKEVEVLRQAYEIIVEVEGFTP